MECCQWWIKSNHDAANEITYNTEILKSNLCDYNNTYILLSGNITVVAALIRQVAFKTCALFTKCITKIDKTTVDGAEGLDLVRPMYNLIEYSSNYSEATESYGFVLKMKHLVLMQILQILIILNLSIIRLNYW